MYILTRLFTDEQMSCLLAFYDKGMVVTGEQYRNLHEKAFKRTYVSSTYCIYIHILTMLISKIGAIVVHI